MKTYVCVGFWGYIFLIYIFLSVAREFPWKYLFNESNSTKQKKNLLFHSILLIKIIDRSFDCIYKGVERCILKKSPFHPCPSFPLTPRLPTNVVTSISFGVFFVLWGWGRLGNHSHGSYNNNMYQAIHWKHFFHICPTSLLLRYALLYREVFLLVPFILFQCTWIYSVILPLSLHKR